MDREADVGGILGQTVDVIGGAGRSVAIYTLVLGAIAGIGGLFGLESQGRNAFISVFGGELFRSEASSLVGSLFQLVNLAVFVIATYFLLRQMMIGLGRRPAAESRFWSFLGMSILAGLGTLLGFVVFIIPGFIVMVRWAAANGFVLTGEHSVTGSLGASWEATDGRGWSIFLAGLVITIALAILVGIVMGAGFQQLAAASSPLLAVVTAVSGFINAFSNAVNFAFSMAVFHLVAPTDTSVADVFE